MWIPVKIPLGRERREEGMSFGYSIIVFILIVIISIQN